MFSIQFNCNELFYDEKLIFQCESVSSLLILDN